MDNIMSIEEMRNTIYSEKSIFDVSDISCEEIDVFIENENYNSIMTDLTFLSMENLSFSQEDFSSIIDWLVEFYEKIVDGIKSFLRLIGSIIKKIFGKENLKNMEEKNDTILENKDKIEKEKVDEIVKEVSKSVETVIEKTSKVSNGDIYRIDKAKISYINGSKVQEYRNFMKTKGLDIINLVDEYGSKEISKIDNVSLKRKISELSDVLKKKVNSDIYTRGDGVKAQDIVQDLVKNKDAIKFCFLYKALLEEIGKNATIIHKKLLVLKKSIKKLKSSETTEDNKKNLTDNIQNLSNLSTLCTYYLKSLNHQKQSVLKCFRVLEHANSELYKKFKKILDIKG